MDIRTTFLIGNLKEEICVDQPFGFVLKGEDDNVCRFKRSIWCLKQSNFYFTF